jgi:hypothetical protein
MTVERPQRIQNLQEDIGVNDGSGSWLLKYDLKQ